MRTAAVALAAIAFHAGCKSDGASRDQPPASSARTSPSAFAEAGALGEVPDRAEVTPTSAGDPSWASLDNIAGCALEYVTNAADVRLFDWEPCSGVGGCERAVFGTSTPIDPEDIGGNPSHVSSGPPVLAGLALPAEGYLATESGELVAAVRTSGCSVGGVSAFGDRYAFSVWFPGNTAPEMAVVGKLGDAKPKAFQAPGIAKINHAALNPTRLAWVGGPPARTVTMSAVDGSNYAVVAEVGGTIFDQSAVDAVPDGFLFSAWRALPNGGEDRAIYRTNGTDPAVPYIEPEPGTSVGSVRFAHSHICWQKGYAHPTERGNRYQRVELWTSKYDPDPTNLVPQLVAEMTEHQLVAMDAFAMSNSVRGAHGRCLTFQTKDFTLDGVPIRKESIGLLLWDLETGTLASQRPLPDSSRASASLGLSATHAWLLMDAPAALMRFRVE